MNINGSINKDKGNQTQAYGNGEKFRYIFLTPNVSPPSMIHNGSIYSPLMGNGASNWRIYRNMEGQGSSYSLLDEGNYKYFLFWAQNLMYAGCIGATDVYTGCITIHLHVYSKLTFLGLIWSIRAILSKGSKMSLHMDNGRPSCDMMHKVCKITL